MSQKQAMGRKKGGGDNIKAVGNAWEGFKKMWIECGSDEYDVWMPIKAPDGWMGENDEFRCEVCMVKEMMKLKREIEDLEKENGMYEEYR